MRLLAGNQNARYRDPLLGRPRELDLPGGRLRAFESGHGDPIVFVHGLGVNANLWRKVISRLAPDFRCIALDLPFGSHTLPTPGSDLSPPGVAELIADAIDALGHDSVCLVANDTGAAICQIVVTRRPERIDRLVLTSCESRGDVPPKLFSYMKVAAAVPGGLSLLMAPMRLRPLRRLPFAYGWLSKRPIEPEVADSYVLAGAAAPGVVADARRFLRSLHRRHTNEAADLLGGFRRPALVAWSREDRFFPAADAERLARDLPDARLAWIDDARTFSAEDRPDRLSELIAEFARR